jgi:hypothetical protein
MTTTYYLTGLAFVLVTAFFYGLLIGHLGRALAASGWEIEKQRRIRRNTILVLVGWTIFLILIAASGFTSRFDLFPANAGPVLIIPLVAILIVTFSGKMKHLLQFVPETTLINLQVFRVFVEVLLWLLFVQNLLPVQMTFEGRNFDILVGITAPLAAWLFAGKKWALIGWNILGLCLLINIVTIALLSMPTQFRVFDNEPANTIVLNSPFILLPGMLVPLAYGLHFLSLRQVALRK